jgi:hypothetical protein
MSTLIRNYYISVSAGRSSYLPRGPSSQGFGRNYQDAPAPFVVDQPGGKGRRKISFN